MALGGSGTGGGAGAIKAGAAFVRLFTKNDMAAGLRAAHKDLNLFGNAVGALGKRMTAFGALGLGALGGLGAAAVKRNSEFGALALKFADTAENLSALSYAAETASASADDLWTGFKRWPLALQDAKVAGSETARIFELLGLNAEQLSNLKITGQFLAVSDAMRSISDNAQRLDILQQLFGKSSGSLNEFIGLGADGIREMMREAESVGAVISTEAAVQSKRIEDTWVRSWKAVRNAALSVGDALLPAEGAIDRISENVITGGAALREWINANQKIVTGTGIAIAGVATLGVGLWALGPAIKLAAASWGIFSGVVALGKVAIGGAMAIISAPILALPAALVAAGAAWLAFTDRGNQAVLGIANAIGSFLGPTIENMKNAWTGVIGAVSNGDFERAFKIGIAVAEVEWIRFTNKFTEIWKGAMAAIGTLWEATAGRIRDGYEETFGIERINQGNGIFINGQKFNIAGQVNRDAMAEAPGAAALRDAQARLNALLAVRAAGAGVMAGGPAIGANLGGELGAQIEQVRAASRGTFGGSASAGFFGGDVGRGIKADTGKMVGLLQQTNRLLGNGAAAGGLVFTGGR